MAWLVALLCVVRLSCAAPGICAQERFAATDNQGRKIWLSSEQLMRRIVVKTGLKFPMFDGGHLQGTVELMVMIDRTGKVACARLVSGHPIAATSAIAAVQNWRFKPFVLRKRRVMVAGRLRLPYDSGGVRVPKGN